MSVAAVVVIDSDEGRSRSGLSAVRLLGQAGHGVTLVVPTAGLDRRRSLSASSHWVSQLIRVVPTTDPAFAPAVDELRCRMDNPPLLVTNDRALLALDLVPRRLVAKDALTAAAKEIGMPTPATQIAHDTAGLFRAVNAMGGSAVVKPTVSLTPARRVTSAELLAAPSVARELLALGPVLVQEPLEGDLTAIAGLMSRGELVAVVHQKAVRTFPLDAGPSAKAVTIEPNRPAEDLLVELLVEHQGLFQAQFIDGRLIDLNMRAYGSMPLAAAAGVNLPDLFVRVHQGRNLSGERPLRARPGVVYRWLDGDLRALVAALRHRPTRTVATFLEVFPRRGTVHSIVDVTDPKPALARLRHLKQRT